ncbi:F-box protein [Acorus calamus]|uniref:F-box protein n=1 Tax=Acorus calamus TaxID=4465 RepID=A0AAV9CA22_ACOCL|nr:F-box protein [Acorus calamus]
MDGDGCSDWVQVKSLGDCALLLGDNHSLCLPVEGVSGLKRNCIYFTNDDEEKIFVDRHGLRDIGVFNMEDGSIERYFHDQQCLFPPPVWFMPNPQRDLRLLDEALRELFR